MNEPESKITKLRAFLDEHRIAALGTVSADSKAHVSTIYYFADETLYFYFVTKNHSAKQRNLIANNSVGLCITDDVKLTTVQLEGRVQVLENVEELVRIVDRLKIVQYGDQQTDNPPISKLYGSFVFYKITPSWLRWVDYKNKWTETSILELKDFSQLLESK